MMLTKIFCITTIISSLLLNDKINGLIIENEEEICPIDDNYSNANADIVNQQAEILNNLKQIESAIKSAKNEIQNLQLLLNEEEKKTNEIHQNIINKNIINKDEISELNKDFSISDTDTSSETSGEIKPYDAWGKTIAKHREHFYDHIKFKAAVQVDGDVTSIYASKLKIKGISKFIAIGDSLGKIYVFSADGDLMVEYDTETKSPIIKILSYKEERNSTTFVTLHKNQQMLLMIGKEKIIKAYTPHDMPISLITEITSKVYIKKENDEENSDLNEIEFISARKVDRIVQFLITYKNNYMEIINYKGKQKFRKSTNYTIFDIKTEKNNFIILNNNGLSWIRMNEMRYMQCQQLKSHVIITGLFDINNRNFAYLITDQYEIILLIFNIYESTCRIKKTNNPIRLPFNKIKMEIIKGYLLLASDLGIGIYNLTSSSRTGPREIILEPYSTIANTFEYTVENVNQPLMDSSQLNFIAIKLSDRVVGFFESNLWITKPKEFKFNIWTQPLLIAFFVLFGYFYVSRGLNERKKRKEEEEFRDLDISEDDIARRILQNVDNDDEYDNRRKYDDDDDDDDD